MSRFGHDYAAVDVTFGLTTILSSIVASDNVFSFKIMSNGVHCSELKSLFPVNNPTYSFRHNQPFYHNVAITRPAENNPIYRLWCVCYNALSLRICIMNLAFHPNSVSKAIKEVTLSKHVKIYFIYIYFLMPYICIYCITFYYYLMCSLVVMYRVWCFALCDHHV